MSKKPTYNNYYVKKDVQIAQNAVLTSAVDEYLADESQGLSTVAAKYMMSRYKLYNAVVDRRTGRQRGTQGPKRLLTGEQEKESADIIQIMAKCGFGYSQLEVRHLVADYCRIFDLHTVRRDGAKVKVEFPSSVPPENWTRGFAYRNSLKRKMPDHMSQSRDWATKNVFIIRPFYDMLEKAVKKLQIEMVENGISLEDTPRHIWNLDESGFKLDPKSKMVYAGTSDRATIVRHGEGKGQYTVLACVNAAGESRPLLCGFKGSYFSRELSEFDVALDERTGWMTTKVFAEWFRRFTLAVKERPLLLLLDGHLSHVSVEVIEMAMQKDNRQLSITILKLPPHATDTLQPLDVGVFGVLKGYWNDDIIEFRRNNNPTGPLTKPNFYQLLTKTWEKVKPEFIQKSFHKTGIYPVDFTKYPQQRLDPVVMEKWRRLEQRGADLDDLDEEEYRKLVCEPLSPKKKSPHKAPISIPSSNPLLPESSVDTHLCGMHPLMPTVTPFSTSNPPTNDRVWKLEWKLEWVARWVPADEDDATTCGESQPGPSDLLSTPSSLGASGPSTPSLTPEERMRAFHQKVLESRLPAKIPVRKTAEVITSAKFLEQRKEVEARRRSRMGSKKCLISKPSQQAPSKHPPKKSLNRMRTPSPAHWTAKARAKQMMQNQDQFNAKNISPITRKPACRTKRYNENS